jgi:Polyketide cyclase / dehydrase and lipid transport
MAAAAINEGKNAAPPAQRVKRNWKSILTYVFLGLVAIVGSLCAVIASRPPDFKISRSATMAATPAAVFEQVNDFHKWDAWSPWVKLDPNAKSTFEGPTSGEGAKLHWDGNRDVGAGSMTIVESEPNDHVRIKLDFIKPFDGTCDVLMKIEPAGDQTKLTWNMAGKNNFIAKAISLFMDCDKMVGAEFEKGLANMKAIVEAKPAEDTSASPGKI